MRKSLVKRVYEITASAPVRRDYAYCNQLRGAAISIMSNIAEGFGRSSDKEFARFLDIARGSGLETQSLFYVGVEVSYLDQATFRELYRASDQIIEQITSLSQYLRSNGSPNSAKRTVLRLVAFLFGLVTKMLSV